MKIETYNLKAGNGKQVRMATKVVLDNGQEIKFMEKMSKREALNQATRYLERQEKFN